LTRFEYTNTVKDLLGVDPSAANDLPADEVTDGFDDNAAVLTVSSLHAEKYVTVSETLARSAVQNLSSLTTCDTTAKGEDACALDFARKFGRRAYRRPTTSDDESLLMLAYQAGRTGGSYAEGIEVMIRAALQSTHFLYRLETTTPSDTNASLVPLSAYELATRLSYLIWATGPDDALLDDAGNGKLGTKDAVAKRARAMFQDPKARTSVIDFYNQWVGTSRLAIMTKSTTLFPSYSQDVRDAMAKELPAFVEYVLWSGDRSLNTLLTSPLAFITGPLAPIYGVSLPRQDDGTPQMVTTLPEQHRAGILTQAAVMAVQAHPDQTSPVLRGKFVRTSLLCQPPPPPPPDVNTTPPDVTAGGTARERFGGHLTAGTSCMGCHALMDPIGFAFENYDAIGQYRTTDANETIDASGVINGAADPALMGTFNGVSELAGKLASSEQVRDCVATQWFRYASGRSEGDDDACSLSNLQDAFAASGGDLVELVVAMTQTDAFWYRAPITQ
ncbi:MAG TPA: DUF1592 domain-containing protein, partial [Burkholderiaceae bacterium]|nr:DUF1592 domain-containing protein [Burkholderiaceae bacterium]